MSTSVAQEFYKIQQEWSIVDKIQSWKLSVWVVEYSDVDIIDKFMEIERSPIGVFDDIFFRFDSEYQGDKEIFEQSLYNEFKSWFVAPSDPKMDMNKALYENNLLSEIFIPDDTLAPTADNLWKEFNRLRTSISGLKKDIHFCIYFPLVAYNKNQIANWFTSIIDAVPLGIRLITVDFAQDRKVKLKAKNEDISPYIYMNPKLDMASAIKNEMKKDGNNYDTVDPHARFRMQVIKVMESTTETINSTTTKEVNILLSITNEIGGLSAQIAGLLVAAQAYYSIRNTDKSEKYTDEALGLSTEAMKNGDPSGYPVWKSCMLLKAALIYGKKKFKEAQLVYEELATKASAHGDAYYAMEGRRLVGHLYYEMGKLKEGLQNMLLALAAGAYLDIELRRQSSFLFAAYMALDLANRTRKKEDVDEIKLQLQDWLGEDWEKLLKQAGIEQSTVKMKTSIFN